MGGLNQKKSHTDSQQHAAHFSAQEMEPEVWGKERGWDWGGGEWE